MLKIKHCLLGWLWGRAVSIFTKISKFLSSKTSKKFYKVRSKDSAGSLNQQKDLTGRFCTNPFRQFDIMENGNVHSCCSSWLPTALGNINKQTPAEAWNSEASIAIRQSIHDGSFKYCDHKLCPSIQSDSLPTIESLGGNQFFDDMREIAENKITRMESGPTFFNFCNDSSCNLSCPSCRVEKMIVREGPEFEKRLSVNEKVIAEYLSEPTDRAFTINVTGSGDPFASKIFRDFLFSLDGKDFPNMKVQLQTNAVLFTQKNWNKLEKIHDNLSVVLVSFDAATAETYAITRRGGRWDLLLENYTHLAEQRRAGKLNMLRTDFVVQADNFREMPDYVRLVKSIGADSVYFSMVVDWRTWSKEVYETKCVWKQTHPDFEEFLTVLQDPIFDDPIVDLGNVTEYRTRALQKMAS